MSLQFDETSNDKSQTNDFAFEAFVARARAKTQLRIFVGGLQSAWVVRHMNANK